MDASDYCIGCDVIGASCRRRASDVVVGWVYADYSWGQTQFKELAAYYDSVGKPEQFKDAFDAVQTGYDNASTMWAIRALFVSDAMKTVGEQSVALRKQIEAWAVQNGKGAAPPAPVPDVPPPEDSHIPWKPILIGTVVIAGLFGGGYALSKVGAVFGKGGRHVSVSR